MFHLSIILENIDEIEITLDYDRPSTGFPPSSPSVILSPDFDVLACGKLIIGILVINTSPLLPQQELSILLLLLGICNFPFVSHIQEEHDNISVFEESDNDYGPFTLVKEGPGHDPITTHLHSVF